MAIERRRTKIVATIGPASSDHDTLRTLVEAGVDSVRLNLSHGTHDDHRASAEVVRAVQAETGKPLADEVITRSLEHVIFSVDPHAETFETLVENGLEAGTQKDGSIDGLFDLRLLNGLLEADDAEPVSAGGLGEE